MATIIKDFAELGKVFHINPKKRNNKKNGKGKKDDKARICKVCGAELRPIKDTNVWVCDGTRTILDEQTGEKRQVPCTHKVLSRRINTGVPA